MSLNKPTFTVASVINESPTLQRLVDLGVNLANWEKIGRVSQIYFLTLALPRCIFYKISSECISHVYAEINQRKDISYALFHVIHFHGYFAAENLCRPWGINPQPPDPVVLHHSHTFLTG